MLERLGIKGYEAQAYLTLLRLGEATASKIAAVAGIPQPRIYNVLESLSRKGLIEWSASKPRKYRAINPMITFPHLAKSLVKELEAVATELAKELGRHYAAEASLLESQPLWLIGSTGTGIEKIKAELEILRGDAVMALDKKLFNNLIARRIRKLGPTAGNIYAIAVLVKEGETIRLSKRLSNIRGLMLKVVPLKSLRMVIIGMNKMYLLLDNQSLEISERGIINMASDFFYYSLWRIGQTIKDINVRRGDRYVIYNQWIAVCIARKALQEGFRIKVRIKGIQVKSGKSIAFEGEVRDAVVKAEGTIRYLLVRTEGNKELTVGGANAVLEDVGAEEVEIYIM